MKKQDDYIIITTSTSEQMWGGTCEPNIKWGNNEVHRSGGWTIKEWWDEVIKKRILDLRKLM